MEKNIDTEVLVIGFGGAGAVAAITAHDAGASVVIIEKMDHGGGNTNLSLGGFLCLKDFDRGLLYLESLCNRVFSTLEPEMIYAYARGCLNNQKWVEDFGHSTHAYGGAAFPELPGADSVEKRMVTGKNSTQENSFWGFIRTEVEKRRITVLNNAPAKSLITDEDGAVKGAVVNINGGKISVKASRAAILACGGFEYNDWMKKNYLKGYPYYSLGSPGNTGDGLAMAQRAGADIWHVSNVSTPLGFKTAEYEAAFLIKPLSMQYIYTDKSGKRFASEVTDVHAYNYLVDLFDTQSLEFPRIPCCMIFDETLRKAGPIAISAVGFNRGRYQWSKDNKKEIDNGWIVSGETIGDLADEIGVGRQMLENTVKRYNQYCESGNDHDYNRPRETMEPLCNGPYYSIMLWPSLLNTQGGPRRNFNAQVLYPDGSLIPRLYSAGELGSLFGLLYQGGGNIGECLAFGRIAGEKAAAEKKMF